MRKLAGSGAIFFRQILFEGADEQSWLDLKPHNFRGILFD
jgi:hypothetical protein